MPKVSVIIPNYNHEKYLERRIESVLNQTYQDFEVIILDDFSTDNSKTIIEQYRGNPLVSHIVFNDKNSGSTFRQWEKGINLAVGEYIWIAESDDWCELNLLEQLMCKYELYSNLGIVYCNSLSYNVETGEKSKGHPHNRQIGDFHNSGIVEINKYLLYSNVIPNASAVVFRKSIYEAVNRVNLEMRLCGDWDLWIRMLQISDIYFVSEQLNYFQFSPNSVRVT
jgi:glycosyltransferase involved in cell wall biosynthesis